MRDCNRKIRDGDFYPFGRDMDPELESDIQKLEDWPEDYANIAISVSYSNDSIDIYVSDMPSCATGGISIITLLEENFKDSGAGGSKDEKLALETLRDCITRLINARAKEIEDYPELSDDEWPSPEWLARRQRRGIG
jgi:hypothetical protein